MKLFTEKTLRNKFIQEIKNYRKDKNLMVYVKFDDRTVYDPLEQIHFTVGIKYEEKGKLYGAVVVFDEMATKEDVMENNINKALKYLTTVKPKEALFQGIPINGVSVSRLK